jgi:hypothetical protein
LNNAKKNMDLRVAFSGLQDFEPLWSAMVYLYQA